MGRPPGKLAKTGTNPAPAAASAGESTPGVPNPFEFLKLAVQEMPAVRYAIGIGGILAVVAIVKAWGIDARTGALATVGMLVLMTALAVFSGMVGKAKHLSLPAQVLAWSAVVIVIAVALLLVTSEFFDWPRNFHPDPAPTYNTEEQHTLQLRDDFVVLRGDWEALGDDRSEARVLAINDRALKIADALQSIRDHKLSMGVKIMKYEDSAYANIIAASTNPDAQNKVNLADFALARAATAESFIAQVKNGLDEDQLKQWISSDNEVDRLTYLDALALCIKGQALNEPALKTQAQQRLKSISPQYLFNNPPERSPDLNGCH